MCCGVVIVTFRLSTDALNREPTSAMSDSLLLHPGCSRVVSRVLLFRHGARGLTSFTRHNIPRCKEEFEPYEAEELTMIGARQLRILGEYFGACDAKGSLLSGLLDGGRAIR
jgi:hypothetical protein